MIMPPCGDCKERAPLCHGKCEKYIEYRKKLEKAKQYLSRTPADEYNISGAKKNADKTARKKRKGRL